MITDDHQLTSKEAEEVKAEWDLGRCLCELKDNLKEVLSDVLQVEMKAVYEELWLEVSCLFYILNVHIVYNDFDPEGNPFIELSCVNRLFILNRPGLFRMSSSV